ncbi:DNA-binding NarL/FixJ family response regulator [Pseudorhizobium tarimense]|uniref:DNA-binding NarL/FixJ family response regulator n=1 Tax=Pseudorhizobium tarimense TaxID=1079109 RepID=A0ABV2HD75_9HYPH|nr:response regulator transcription factor [Pseudorhizobium tarimense]MCJ8521526.1 response regulator transcription factor [Pseudorhizobium tarimense]
MTSIRVAVVDDHPLFREGVVRSLGECPGLEIVAEGASRDDAIAIAGTDAPDVMLMDISMPGNGLNAIKGVLEKQPHAKIVMLTVSEAGEDLASAVRMGAKGYVLKGIGSQGLTEVVKTVASGQSYVAPTLSARLVESLSQASEPKSNPFAELTQREMEVLNLVASGLSNKRIAIALDLHEKTIKHHMTRIFTKLNVTNRTEAALALRDARREGSAEGTQARTI